MTNIERLGLPPNAVIDNTVTNHENRRGMSQPRICPSCQCIFYQDFVCTTCGAEKLNNETIRVQQDQLAAVTKQRDIAVATLKRITPMAGGCYSEWAAKAISQIEGETE